MYKNKNPDGTLNICGNKVATLRKNLIPKVSQRKLADMLQLKGLDMDKNAVQKIEHGKRFVTDIELKVIADIFNVTSDCLLGKSEISNRLPAKSKIGQDKKYEVLKDRRIDFLDFAGSLINKTYHKIIL